MFPNVLFEPPQSFEAGYPWQLRIGEVDERFKQSNRVWLVRDQNGIYALLAICTHLGCTPNWLQEEQKFKCPCHGSGYTPEGINFEGPAPRPMDRAQVELDPSGQIVVDVGRLYEWPKGQPSEFDDKGAYLQV